MIGWQFENTYAQLPSVLFEEVEPAKMPAPAVAVVNHRLADELGLALGNQPPEKLAGWLAGQRLPAGTRPIAQAYAGHQFGGFTVLGDGRAILLGELRSRSGQRLDVQLKGSGRTSFSRGGDGRAALGPMLREYIISEAMHALGIPSTQSLAVVTTGEPVYRATPLRGAVLARVAASHIRVGTFQYLAARRDESTLRILADYAIARHFPELVNHSEKYLGFLRAVIDRQASLISRWQLVGFVHGVMNTDNMTISGETIDYGPCAFLDTYHPQTVFSSIDHGGRYAYGNQPHVGQWNLARFAEAILPLLGPIPERGVELATEALHEYPAQFDRYWLAGMRRKLGLWTDEADDPALIRSLLDWMARAALDYTNLFDDLTSCPTFAELPDALQHDSTFRDWYLRWQQRLEREGQSLRSAQVRMQAVNPAVIPRNHRVEDALAAATDDADLSVMNTLLEAISTPFDRHAERAFYRSPPPPGQRPYRTFCGT